MVEEARLELEALGAEMAAGAAGELGRAAVGETLDRRR